MPAVHLAEDGLARVGLHAGAGDDDLERGAGARGPAQRLQELVLVLVQLDVCNDLYKGDPGRLAHAAGVQAGPAQTGRPPHPVVDDVALQEQEGDDEQHEVRLVPDGVPRRDVRGHALAQRPLRAEPVADAHRPEHDAAAGSWLP